MQAQQRAQYTQYIMNNYVLNPAAGGVNNYWDIKAGFRGQWAGFTGAPTTLFASAHGPIGYPDKRVRNSHLNAHQGFGGYIFHDATGPISMTGISLSYSYHVKLSSKYTASAGAFAGILQYKLDGNQLVFVQTPEDPAIGKITVNKILPDATVGIWINSDKAFFGVSVNQLFANRIKLPGAVPSTGKLNYHYFLTGGYRFPVSEKMDFIPSAMLKYVQGAPVQFDLNARVKYNKMFWLGASYRHQDAIAALIGMTYKNQFELGYSYDVTTSRLRVASWGSHEIIVGVNLAGRKRGKVLCPMDYWN
jgi:type IX secretion system PorP/SprF family membrane protein